MAKSEKKRGLGRGLSALMSDVTLDEPRDLDAPTRAPTDTLPIEWIKANPDQPRKTFPQSDMDDLVASIQAKGIIQPLVVRKMEDTHYQLVAGERRWRAAQAANLHEVPVVVRAFSDVEVLEIAIIENIQRADLNPIEEAAGYRQLMDRFGHTQEKLAEGLGKSRSYIANLLRLLQLPPVVQTLVETGKLSAGHARALITSDNAEVLAKQVVDKGLSVRETEALVKSGALPKQKPNESVPGASTKDADTKALEGDLSAALGMKVSLDHKPGAEGGSMTIKYLSLEQLDELCQKLSS